MRCGSRFIDPNGREQPNGKPAQTRRKNRGKSRHGHSHTELRSQIFFETIEIIGPVIRDTGAPRSLIFTARTYPFKVLRILLRYVYLFLTLSISLSLIFYYRQLKINVIVVSLSFSLRISFARPNAERMNVCLLPGNQRRTTVSVYFFLSFFLFVLVARVLYKKLYPRDRRRGLFTIDILFCCSLSLILLHANETKAGFVSCRVRDSMFDSPLNSSLFYYSQPLFSRSPLFICKYHIVYLSTVYPLSSPLISSLVHSLSSSSRNPRSISPYPRTYYVTTYVLYVFLPFLACKPSNLPIRLQ